MHRERKVMKEGATLSSIISLRMMPICDDEGRKEGACRNIIRGEGREEEEGKNGVGAVPTIGG